MISDVPRNVVDRGQSAPHPVLRSEVRHPAERGTNGSTMPLKGRRILKRKSVALLEDLKKSAERITGWQRPAADQLASLLRRPKRGIFRFRDDGKIPNHPGWPVVIYWSIIHLPRTLDPAAVIEDFFASNGWGKSWRNGIYDSLHYHSRIHEVLGIACGSAKVRLGGDRGRTLKLSAGDVVILPAGTGHQCLAASKDFLVVGAYPPSGAYDECRPSADAEEHQRRVKSVAKVKRPRKDPVFGAKGPILKMWKLKR